MNFKKNLNTQICGQNPNEKKRNICSIKKAMANQIWIA